MHERFRMLSGLSAVQELLERVTIPRQTLDPQLMRPTDESAEEIPAKIKVKDQSEECLGGKC